jgi:hypothetical protein
MGERDPASESHLDDTASLVHVLDRERALGFGLL